MSHLKLIPKRYSGEVDPPRAAQSFRKSEIDGMRSLLSILRRGGDVSVLLRSEDIRSIERKFNKMAANAKPDSSRGQA
jgi:hypothetical protein